MSLRDDLRALPPEALLPAGWVLERLGAAEGPQAGTEPPEPLGGYTVESLAAELGRAPSTIRNWLAAGQLEGAFKLGREWRIPADTVQQMLARQAAEHKASRRPKPKREGEPADLSAWRQHAKGAA